jgi:hypothetical protein
MVLEQAGNGSGPAIELLIRQANVMGSAGRQKGKDPLGRLVVRAVPQHVYERFRSSNHRPP